MQRSGDFLPLQYFLEREQALLGERFAALHTPPGGQAARGVTVNTLRCTPERFAAESRLPLAPSPFCGEAFLLAEDACRPGRHPYHHAGVFYSQEPSAAAPAPRLGVLPGMRVLDLCAAPGGKSSQLAAFLAGEGLLVSNEFAAARARILESNLERMGVVNALILNESPERIAQALPGYFDRVLVDAPCSGEGMFRKEPQAAVQHSEALVRRCAALGAEILDAAAETLAPGGLLVYSTCTFAPEEDEGQAASFLARHPEFTLLDWGGEYGSPGEPNRCGGLPIETDKLRRIWPAQGGEGHFMACFRKAGALLPRPESLPVSASCPAWPQFAAEFFPALRDRPALMQGDRVFLPPLCGLPRAAQGLRTVRAGVFAGTVKKGRFEPAHHLFTAFGAQCANVERLTLGDPRVEQYLQGQTIRPETAVEGWCAVLIDGFPLGGGKVSGGVLKNHYPKGLRLLGNLAF